MVLSLGAAIAVAPGLWPRLRVSHDAPASARAAAPPRRWPGDGATAAATFGNAGVEATLTLLLPTPVGMGDHATGNPCCRRTVRSRWTDPTASLRPCQHQRRGRRGGRHLRARQADRRTDIAATCSASATRSPARSPASTLTSPGEVARDIFCVLSHVDTDPVGRGAGHEVDITKTMSITCEWRKLVNFSTVYLDATNASSPA